MTASQFREVNTSGAFVIFGFNTDVKYGDTVYHVQSEARQHELLLQTQVFVKGRCLGKHATSYAEKTKEPSFSEDLMHEMLKEQHKHFVTAVREGRIEAELADEEEDELKAAVAAFAEPAAPAAPAIEFKAPPQPAATPAIDLQAAKEAASEPLDIAVAPAPLDDLAAQFAAAVAEKPADEGFSLTAAGSVIGKGLNLDCSPPTPTQDGSAVSISVTVTDGTGPAIGAQVSCRVSAGQGPAAYVYATSGESGVADVVISLAGLNLSGTALLIQATHRGKSASRKYQLTKS